MSTDAPASQAPPPRGSKSKPARKSNTLGNLRPLRSFKSYDPMLDAWYFNEVNTRFNKDVGLFRNYQINPYTKKTLDYVTPKITERRRPILDNGCCEDAKEVSPEDAKLRESYKTVREAIYKSINVPKTKFCQPQTELMRLGWFPDYQPPPTNNSCLYIQTCWSDKPCCYFYPNNERSVNENYDERFRAVHQTAEFIRTETKLRAFDAIMNPTGHRGKVKTERIRPGSISVKKASKK